MRFIHVLSRWGNLYRHSYYLNGKRVTQLDWENAFASKGLKPEDGKSETTSYGFRTIWEA